MHLKPFKSRFSDNIEIRLSVLVNLNFGGKILINFSIFLGWCLLVPIDGLLLCFRIVFIVDLLL